MNILGIIPARCGSKGIPGKNIIDVCGKPLIAYSINIGNELVTQGALSRCIVSTDCNEIANVATEYDADVPFIRPECLATDESKSIDFMLHSLEWMKKRDEIYDAVMLLQPTSPMRDVVDIIKAVNDFKSGNSNSLISCYNEEYINDLVMYKENGAGYLIPHNDDHNKGVRRQEHGATYIRNGAVYITRTSYLYRHKRIICDQPMLLEMTKKSSIDVDTMDDLEILRAVMCK